MLRVAAISPTDDVPQTGSKPFAPLFEYNDEELTRLGYFA
jgi:hypothetical protein